MNMSYREAENVTANHAHNCLPRRQALLQVQEIHMQRLTGKSCLVTGGARGIGKAIAAAFATEGADVVITDIDDETGRQSADEIGAQYAHLDVSSEDDWNDIAQTYPHIDVMVNNAGITGFEDGPAAHDPENASLAEWHRVHAVNLDGTFLGCRYAIRAMRAKGSGSIINISSRSGLVGIPGRRPCIVQGCDPQP